MTCMTASLDLASRDGRCDPFPLYRRLREEDPVHWSPHLGMWIVTRYDDVGEILASPTRFSVERFRHVGAGLLARRPDMREVAGLMREWAVYRDPPEHTRLRGLLNRTFTPRRIEELRPRIRAIVADLLDRLPAGRPVDFIAAFAYPLPATVIATMLGVPAEDIGHIKIWSDRIAAYIGGGETRRGTIEEAKAGLLEAASYFHELAGERRRRPREDLLSLLVSAEHRGDALTDDEVVGNCTLLLFAGHETTTNLLGNGLFHLLRHPAQHALVRGQPDLVPGAIEELLRYDPPVAGTLRVTLAPTTLRGRSIRQGELVAAMLAAANRDPDRFERADELDVRRDENRHLAFGHGIHFCLGAPLARLEAQIALAAVLERFGRIALVDEAPSWKPQIFFRGLAQLHIEVRP
jgi:hypothetical protein